MDYAAWDARLSTPTDKGGASQRVHLENAAERGNANAIALLTPPPFPDALAYLWEQFVRLNTMRDVGMNGPKRFTPTLIRDAALLFDWDLQPHEVEALTALDVVTLHPNALDAT